MQGCRQRDRSTSTYMRNDGVRALLHVHHQRLELLAVLDLGPRAEEGPFVLVDVVQLWVERAAHAAVRLRRRCSHRDACERLSAVASGSEQGDRERVSEREWDATRAHPARRACEGLESTRTDPRCQRRIRLRRPTFGASA